MRLAACKGTMHRAETFSSPHEWDIVVVGAAYTDCVGRGPRLPGEGEDVRGDAFLQLPGGKGLNQAIGLVEGRSLGEAVRYAYAASALAITVLGAFPSMPRREAVDHVLKH